MEKPEISEIFTLPGGHLIPLRHITLVSTVSLYFGTGGGWTFNIHVQWGNPLIGNADYNAVYLTQFEAVAVREALWAAVIRERLSESQRRARLEW